MDNNDWTLRHSRDGRSWVFASRGPSRSSRSSLDAPARFRAPTGAPPHPDHDGPDPASPIPRNFSREISDATPPSPSPLPGASTRPSRHPAAGSGTTISLSPRSTPRRFEFQTPRPKTTPSTPPGSPSPGVPNKPRERTHRKDQSRSSATRWCSSR